MHNKINKVWKEKFEIIIILVVEVTAELRNNNVRVRESVTYKFKQTSIENYIEPDPSHQLHRIYLKFKKHYLLEFRLNH